MQATRAPARSQRASRVIAALPVIATTFFMNAMVWRYFRQFKMPRPDAYRPAAAARLARTLDLKFNESRDSMHQGVTAR